MNMRAVGAALGRRLASFGQLVVIGMTAIAAFAGSLLLLVGLLLLPVGLGRPLLAVLWAPIRRLTDAHRRWAARHLGSPIPAPDRARTAGLPRVRELVGTGQFWRDLLWLFGHGVLAPVMVVISLAVSAYGVVAVLAPIIRIGSIGLAVGPGRNVPLTMLSGVLALVIVGWAAPKMLGRLARLARLLLGPRAADRAAIDAASKQPGLPAAPAAELRRIERDLHDGTQAKLVALGMNMGLARKVLDTDPAYARDLLAEAAESTSAALTELRLLVRGIQPPLLTERGLEQAVRQLCRIPTMPVAAHIDLPGRFAAPIESAVYFALAESLTNVTKHSGAHSVRLDLDWADGRVHAVVSDDGTGGADPERGSGLRGLSGRLASVAGTLTVHSPPGGPTVLTLDVPGEPLPPATAESSPPDQGRDDQRSR